MSMIFSLSKSYKNKDWENEHYVQQLPHSSSGVAKQVKKRKKTFVIIKNFWSTDDTISKHIRMNLKMVAYTLPCIIHVKQLC